MAMFFYIFSWKSMEPMLKNQVQIVSFFVMCFEFLLALRENPLWNLFHKRLSLMELVP